MAMATTVSIFILLLIAILLYSTAVVIYRLVFHPLAKFPGPKIAAATRWYEFYQDILKRQGGQFALEIDRMHDTYGPIVRINPEELHIKDSDYYSIFYSGTRDKYGWAASMVGAEEASFGTKDHELHRIRRSANAKYLSKRSVLAREYVITEAMSKVVQILKTTPSTIDLHPLLLAFTTEVVRQFTLHQSSGLLDEAESRLKWRDTLHASLMAIPILKQFNWFMALAHHLPLSFLNVIAPPVAQLLSVHQATTRDAQAFLNNPTRHDSADTIFHAIYNSSLPQSEKTAFRLSQEVFTIATAAGSTTAHHLVYGVYYLVSNPEKLTPFQQAVRSLKDDIPSWTDLSTHPYIRATIKEVLRLRGMTAGRSPLLAPVPLQYGEWVIPKKTPLSLTVRDVLLDPRVFQDPMSFIPERWLGDTSSIDQYFVPFGKGSRNCQGLELAWAELYIGLGSLFRNFDIELVDLDFERDLRYTRECLIALPREESRSVRVKVRSITD